VLCDIAAVKLKLKSSRRCRLNVKVEAGVTVERWSRTAHVLLMGLLKTLLLLRVHTASTVLMTMEALLLRTKTK
jgi:hypothetical protein